MRDPFRPLLEEPTVSGVHELLGAFLVREAGWRIFYATFLAGSILAVLAATLYLTVPIEGIELADQFLTAMIAVATPFVGIALWMRFTRRQLAAQRIAFAEAVAELLEELIVKLEVAPLVDERLRREALRRSASFPRLRRAVERTLPKAGALS